MGQRGFRSPAKAGAQSYRRSRSWPWAPAYAGAPLRSRTDRDDGFTLVELMVVIVILGILATIVVINVLPSGEKARVTKAKADIQTIEGALQLYQLQVGSFPSTAQGLQALRTAPQGVDATRYQPGGYLRRLENDPWGRPYLYASPGRHGETDVWTYGRDGKEGGEGADADIGNWDPSAHP